MDNVTLFNLGLSLMNTCIGFWALVISAFVFYYGYWVQRIERKHYIDKWRLETRVLAAQLPNSSPQVEFLEDTCE